MNTNSLFLKNASIVNEGHVFKGHVLIKNGLIEEIFDARSNNGVSPDIKSIDLEGLWLLPGVIDDHVHFREPGLTHKADIHTESRAAVAGGITSFMEMPNTKPLTTNQDLLEEKFHLGSEHSLANYSFYIGATNENIDQIRATDPSHVCGIKVFMGSSTGNMLVDDPQSLSRIFKEARVPVAVHCEDETIIKNNLKQAISRWGDNIPMDQHPVIRSTEACYLSTSLAISLARKEGTRLHILHMTTAREMELLEANHYPEQKQITAEVCVHHLWFSDQDYKEKGGLVKWNPAVKSTHDRQILQEALSQGKLDVVATDHAPHTLDEKNNPYLDCPSGGPMIQHSLPVMLEFVKKGIYSIEQVVKYMSHNPALIFGIKNRGFIRKGYAADLVAVNPETPYAVKKDQILYKCGWSPLEGANLSTSVAYTIINGNIVYNKGTIIEGVNGMPLEFSR